MTHSDHLLQVNDLRVYYHSTHGEYKVVDGVNLTVNRKEILGLAGESGCGKSTVVEGVLRLVRKPGYIAAGSAVFSPRPHDEPSAVQEKTASNTISPTTLADGVDLLTLMEAQLRELRWKYISYIP